MDLGAAKHIISLFLGANYGSRNCQMSFLFVLGEIGGYRSHIFYFLVRG